MQPATLVQVDGIPFKTTAAHAAECVAPHGSPGARAKAAVDSAAPEGIEEESEEGAPTEEEDGDDVVDENDI